MPSNMKAPAFQFYADDFISGVSDMTQAEIGAYIMLLANQWTRGEIPSDPARAALIAKGEVSPHVMSKFPNGKNERLEIVRKKQDEFRERCSAAGKRGGRSPAHDNAKGTLSEPLRDSEGLVKGTLSEPLSQNKALLSPISSLQSPSPFPEKKAFDFPHNLNTPAFAAAWEDWCGYNRERRKPLKPSTVNMQLAEMSKWGEAAAIAAIRKSIMSNWTGVFDPTEKGQGQRNGGGVIDPKYDLF